MEVHQKWSFLGEILYSKLSTIGVGRSFKQLWKAKNPTENQNLVVADLAQCHT
jgi:hypothetical protein